jgi:hypothetical protein
MLISLNVASKRCSYFGEISYIDAIPLHGCSHISRILKTREYSLMIIFGSFAAIRASIDDIMLYLCSLLE